MTFSFQLLYKLHEEDELPRLLDELLNRRGTPLIVSVSIFFIISAVKIQARNFTSQHITLPHSIPHHITSQHLTSTDFTSHHIILHHTTSHYITSHHITSHHITLHSTTLHHITSPHLTSHHITLHQMT